ncbi:hypothetical protein PG988_014874 [Apiospora saccharicola]
MAQFTVDLYEILPRAGMVVDHTKPFLSSQRRDKLLLRRLRLAGVVGNAFFKRNQYRKPMNEALTGMVNAAAESEHLRPSSKENTDDEKVVPFLTFVEEVQARTTWASSMSASLFVDLFAAEAAQAEIEVYKLVGGFDEDEDEKEGEVPAAAQPDPTKEENAAEGAAMEQEVAQGFEKMEVNEEGEKMDVD